MSARSLLSRATSPGGATAELARCDTAGSLERLGEGELVVVADLVGDVADALALLEQVRHGHAPSGDVGERWLAYGLTKPPGGGRP
jgi:hypothetical protein